MTLCGSSVRKSTAVAGRSIFGGWYVSVKLSEPTDILESILLIPDMGEVQAKELAGKIRRCQNGEWTIMGGRLRQIA